MLTERGKQYMREHYPDRYGVNGAELALDTAPPPDDWEPPPDDDPHRDRAHEPREDRRADADNPIWTFIDGATFILDIPPTIPALWGEAQDVVWADGESLMIAGPMGLGKTTLGLRLLRARLGLGDSTLLGYPVAPFDGNILYLAMDRPPKSQEPPTECSAKRSARFCGSG